MSLQKILIVGAWFAAPGAFAASVPQPYRVGPPPAWVNVAPDAPLATAAKPVEAGDTDYLLVDRQVRLLKTTDRYSRYVERLVNQAAVDSSASISISIDPEHEFVWLHEVRVFRDGHVLDKLAEARRSLLNREENLEQRLIDGRVTLHLLLQDVRIGDVLDYSFTAVRTDPISERGFNDWFGTQWATPVRHARVRVLHPANRRLHELDLSGLPPPHRVGRMGWVETTWEGKDIDPLANESARPGWDYRYARLELSEFADWKAVRDWARPLYVVDSPDDVRLAAQIAALETRPEGAERILAALRFVQDDVRYTGLEIGAGAWRPTQPGEVLARRFGDCKDKVLLLVTLLRGLDIEAYPALVHSTAGKGLITRLPGPNSFDHVIAKIRWQGRDYWLDATASGQGGDLDSLVQADYGLALVLDGSNLELETMPAREGATLANYILETYDLSKGADQPATLTVHTTLRDEEADNMRVKMRRTTATQLGKVYLDYYRKHYGGIRVAQALAFADDRDRNVFTIDESYEIVVPFEKDDDGKRKFYLEAYLITERAAPPEQAARTSPLALRFPQHVRQEIVAHLPGEWHIDDANVTVSDPAFEYQSTARYHGHKVELSYELRNKRDYVPVAQLGEFLTKLDKMHDDAFYTFTDGDAGGTVAANKANGPNAALIVSMLMGLGIGAWSSILLKRSRWKLPEAQADAPRGLGGWMVVPAFGLGASIVYLLIIVPTWFRDIGLAAQFDGLDFAVQWLLLLEFLTISSLLVLLPFGVWQMLRRQRTFPCTFILIQLLALAMGLFDNIALVKIASSDAPPEFVKLTFRAFTGALWIAYMLSSERVRATFVNAGSGAAAPGAQPVPG